MSAVAIKDMNRDQLRELARMLGIQGRSRMNSETLRNTVRRAFQSAPLPLSPEARTDNYKRQNGSEKLTPAQRRRNRKKVGVSMGRTTDNTVGTK